MSTSTHPANELLRLWVRDDLELEQAIGYMLQHIVLLTQHLTEAEKHIRQLEAAVPAIHDPLPRTQAVLKTSI